MLKIFAGLGVRRPAVLSVELTPFQQKMQDFFMDLEIQRSHLSAHEVRHLADLERMAQSAKQQQEGKGTGRSDEAGSLLTAKDLELAWEASEKEFWKQAEEIGSYNVTYMPVFNLLLVVYLKEDGDILVIRKRYGSNECVGISLIVVISSFTGGSSYFISRERVFVPLIDF